MRVRVEYIGRLRVKLNKRGEDVEVSDGATLRELLGRLAETHGEIFKEEIFESGMEDLKDNWVALVNGILSTRLKGLETRLGEGDSVAFVPFMSGG
ncbi:MAG: MoaD/ThiS family protein [Candidatus Bathyarchaeia archaeon]